MTKYTIKQLKSDQIKDFFNLFKQITTTDFKNWTKESKDYWYEKQYTPQYWKDNIENKNFPIFVAYDKEKMIGFVITESLDFGVAYLGWLGVLKEYRRKGIAKALLDRLESWCRDNGVHKIELETQEKDLRKFYEEHGYTFEGTRKNSWQHLDSDMFGKEL
jgi:GNAT superfamily N-acetyltransferase